MKHSILPKSPLSTPRPHTGFWGVLTVIGLILRVILQLTDYNRNDWNRRDV